MPTKPTRVLITISGDMIDAFAEIILGILFMSGLLRGHKMTKTKNDDGSYTLLLRIESKEPPLGELGLDDIEDEL